MKTNNKTILLAAVLAPALGVSAAVATLHSFHRGVDGADRSKSSGPADHNLAVLAADDAQAAPGHQHHPGQEDSSDPRPEFREIKSLTADEIRAYQEGTGFGMAKAAERNHYPGPRHVLDLAEQLQLTDEQIHQIRAVQDVMHVAAVSAGNQLIADERRLNVLFAQSRVDRVRMASLVAEIAALQGRLRLIHLDAHWQTQRILSATQIARYDELRGYARVINETR